MKTWLVLGVGVGVESPEESLHPRLPQIDVDTDVSKLLNDGKVAVDDGEVAAELLNDGEVAVELQLMSR